MLPIRMQLADLAWLSGSRVERQHVPPDLTRSNASPFVIHPEHHARRFRSPLTRHPSSHTKMAHCRTRAKIPGKVFDTTPRTRRLCMLSFVRESMSITSGAKSVKGAGGTTNLKIGTACSRVMRRTCDLLSFYQYGCEFSKPLP